MSDIVDKSADPDMVAIRGAMTLQDLERYRFKFEPLSEEEERLRCLTGLRRAQWEIYRHPARFRVACCGRRFGKTETLIAELVRAAQTGYRRNVIYIAPYLKQARQIFWKKLIVAVPKSAIAEKNETLMELKLKGYESTIRCFGADNMDALRGNGYDFAAIDECANVDEALWKVVLRPALADTQGEAIFVGTPAGRSGFFYKIYTEAEANESGEWAAFSFTSLDGQNIAPEELLSSLRDSTWDDFSQEFLATFNSSIGLVYSNFERKSNISKDAVDPGSGPIVVGVDFNVAPLAAVIGRYTPEGHLHIFDEVCLWGGHTQMFAQEILRRYPNREILCYPDPSGRQRKTSAGGNTDFSILAKAGFKLFAPSRTVQVKDRINVMQAMFLNTEGQRRLQINPRCKNLIESLDRLSYMDNGKPVKDGFADNFCDAASFITHYCNSPRAKLGMAKLGGTY